MKSIKDVYKIGYGPSSSHTMGPQKAALLFKEKYKDLKRVDIYLYDSLALTGKGHLTDYILEKTFVNIETNIFFQTKEKFPKHENSMKFIGTLENDEKVEWMIYSIGGGDIEIEGLNLTDDIDEVYPHRNINEICSYCDERNIRIIDYILEMEPEIIDYLSEVWETMKKSIANGLSKSEELPGLLKIKRKAKVLYEKANGNEDLLLDSYAYAVNEENASGGLIVTAPTCGASGVIPACFKFYQDKLQLDDQKMIEGLAVAGLFGAVVKNNATVSGAEAGCQAEVGVATAMAAAGIMHLNDGSNLQIHSAAEIGLEHQIGLTCDPVLGYVQVPCIQRNAVAALKAKNSYLMAKEIAAFETVDFDTIVQVMYETGKDLNSRYRETSMGGLAIHYKARK